MKIKGGWPSSANPFFSLPENRWRGPAPTVRTYRPGNRSASRKLSSASLRLPSFS